MSYPAALTCLVVAAILAAVTHPRIWYGKGTSSFLSFDDLFFAAQWSAVCLTIAALGLSLLARGNGPPNPIGTWSVPILAAGLLGWLLATGIPHPANRGSWNRRDLGIGGFARGIAIRRAAADAQPRTIAPDVFAGRWRDAEGTMYQFEERRITWTGPSNSGAFAAANCGATFQVEYTDRPREVLQEHGFTWSAHAMSRYDATDAAARIPVVQALCDGVEGALFIRATADEIWRWTSSMRVEDMTAGAFVLRRDSSDAR